MGVQIVPAKHVGIFCECESDASHDRMYDASEVAENGLVCLSRGGRITIEAFGIDTVQADRDVRLFLKNIKDLQKKMVDFESAKKRGGKAGRELSSRVVDLVL